MRRSQELLLEAVGCPKTSKNRALSSGTPLLATVLRADEIELYRQHSQQEQRLGWHAFAFGNRKQRGGAGEEAYCGFSPPPPIQVTGRPPFFGEVFFTGLLVALSAAHCHNRQGQAPCLRGASG